MSTSMAVARRRSKFKLRSRPHATIEYMFSYIVPQRSN